MLKQILCYGDSNTWGYDPATKERFDVTIRYPRVLGQLLGTGYAVIEEGQPGRTTVWNDPIEGFKNGRDYLIPCLESHRPLDLVMIMLGTNDLKQRFGLSAFEIAQGAGTLVKLVQTSAAGWQGFAPQVLLLAPPPTSTLSGFAEMFVNAGPRSQQFGVQYARVADELGCAFLDTGTVISSSPIDGIHFDAAAHRKLASALATKVRALLG